MATRRRLGVLTDIRPLQVSHDYRRLWLGNSVSQLGTQMATVAIAIQVYDLTRSTFAVGLVGGCALVPMIAFGLYGGTFSDALDRRKVALVSSLCLWALSLLLVAQSAAGVQSVPLLYAIVAAQAAFSAVNGPARTAIVPRLVPADMLPAAAALNMASYNLGFTLGPLFSGLLIGWSGFTAAYAVDAITFAAALYALSRLPAIPPLDNGEPVMPPGLRSVVEGLRFLRRSPNLQMTFVLDLCAMVFAQTRALFPAAAVLLYGGGARTAGLLQASPAIGALLAFSVSGWITRVRRQGLAIAVAVSLYGLFVAGFGLSTTLWVGVVFLALSGAADMELGVPGHRPSGRGPRPAPGAAAGGLHRGRRGRSARRRRGGGFRRRVVVAAIRDHRRRHRMRDWRLARVCTSALVPRVRPRPPDALRRQCAQDRSSVTGAGDRV